MGLLRLERKTAYCFTPISLEREACNLQIPLTEKVTVISHALAPKDANCHDQRHLENSLRQKWIANCLLGSEILGKLVCKEKESELGRRDRNTKWFITSLPEAWPQALTWLLLHLEYLQRGRARGLRKRHLRSLMVKYQPKPTHSSPLLTGTFSLQQPLSTTQTQSFMWAQAWREGPHPALPGHRQEGVYIRKETSRLH